MKTKEQRQLIRSQLGNKRLDVIEVLAHVTLPDVLDALDEMEQALKPFADRCPIDDPRLGIADDGAKVIITVTARDLRRARAALGEES